VEIEKLMRQAGKTLNVYSGIELPNPRDKGTWKQAA
jgi:hypothetical protein